MKLLDLENLFFDHYCRFHPTTATSLGIRKYNGEFPDFSSICLREYRKVLSEIEGKAEFLQGKGGWDVQDDIDLSLLRSKIALELKEIEVFQNFRRDPSTYVGEALYGLWFLLVRPFSKEEKFRGLLGRVNEIPNLFGQGRDLLENPSLVWVRIACEEVEGLLNFLKECEDELLSKYPKARREIQKAFERASQETQAFKNFLKQNLLKKARGRFAVGRREFDFLLREYHGFSEEAPAVLKIGKEVFDQTLEELKGLAGRIRKRASWEKLIDEIKRRHPSQKKLIAAYQAAVRRTKGFLLKNKLVSIPAGETLKVVPTPPFARSTIPYAAYIDPPLFAEDRTGHFFVTPVSGAASKADDYLKEHSHASLIITALHEGYPGHHLQFVWQADLKRPIRKIFNSSSYYEGWALYCEEMMGEAGFYDAPARLLQLKDKLWRACRVIVDVGMQTQGMTDDEAVNFLSKNARMSKAAARADVNWYTQRPTVPLSYLTGMLKIKRLREDVKREWGRGYSLKKFHDWFLSFGAIPISLVRKALSYS